MRRRRNAAAMKHAPRMAPTRNIARSPEPFGCGEEAEMAPFMRSELGVGAGLGRRGGACCAALVVVGIEDGVEVGWT